MIRRQRTLRWKREPRHKGLMGLGQMQGWELWLEKTRVASVGHKFKGFSRELEGYYTSGAAKPELGIEWFNTSCDGVRATPQAAMADAERVIREAMSGKYHLKFRRPEGMEDA